MQRPARETPATVRMRGLQRVGGQGLPQVDPVFRVGPTQETSSLVHHGRLMEEAHVKRRLARELKRRIAERLFAEAVGFSVRGSIVIPQANVHAVIRLIGGGGDDVEQSNP